MIFDGGVTARQLPQIVAVERIELPRDPRGVDGGFPG